MSIWREPDEESVGLYPGLVVHDGRVSGSITIGQSRLPVWAIVGALVGGGWGAVEHEYGPFESGFDKQALAWFLADLLEARGEFGRLLLVLADAERRDRERTNETLEPHEGLVNVSPWDPEAVQLPEPWWQDRELAGRVRAQLVECVAALDRSLDEEDK